MSFKIGFIFFLAFLTLLPCPEGKSMPAESAGKTTTLNHNKELVAKRKRLLATLLNRNFSYPGEELVDPFIPFTTKTATPPPGFELPGVKGPARYLPLTPLQKMSLGEIERGLKAILTGPMGKKALIEDSAGKGYIVNIGTPVVGNKGIITDIFKEGLVIRLWVWSEELSRYVIKEITVPLRKEQP